ncbi:hypothetical protein PHET_08841 [Paragonimus heterotremus]|uniref:Uncharacterized protein n=1 Tax=Paragonimus heterotremus TaxID=100268 RepID=A0A8J4TB45_9TREM|nr:hypothetical protein PHET_08841 [Paragonimus heterotremus]
MMKTCTGKVRDKEDEPIESLNSSPTRLLPSDSDQTVRKRNKSAKVDKNEHNKNLLSSSRKILEPVDDRFPSTLGRLAIWVIISFLAGLSLHVSPRLILALYTHPASEVVQLVLGVQPLISDFYVIGLSIWFGLLILLVPVSIRLLQWLLVAPVQTKQPWCATIVLLGWTLFLACATCLNVSASLLMSLFVVPVLLLFVHKSRQPRWFSSLFGLCWLIVSPPVLLAVSCLAQIYYFDPIPAAHSIDVRGVLTELWTCVTRVPMQLLLEADLFGCWTWPAITAGFSSLWLLTWSNLYVECN